MKTSMGAVFGLLLCGCPSAVAGSDLPPPPDRAAIASMAQREDPGIPYVAAMPDRHVECSELAQPYFNSRRSGHQLEGGTILSECHIAMLVKMSKIHYRPDAFGPGGMEELVNRLWRDLDSLYLGINDGPIDCRRYCGSIVYPVTAGKIGWEFERAVETMALLQVPPSEQEQWLKSWNRAGWLK